MTNQNCVHGLLELPIELKERKKITTTDASNRLLASDQEPGPGRRQMIRSVILGIRQTEINNVPDVTADQYVFQLRQCKSRNRHLFRGGGQEEQISALRLFVRLPTT